MKILYLVTKGTWGGAQRYVYDLACASAAAGESVVVAAGIGVDLAKRLETAGIKTVRLGADRDIRLGAEIALAWHLIRLYRREQPDIIHLSSPKIVGLGALAGRICNVFSRRKIFIVSTIHGWSFNETHPAWQRACLYILSWVSAVLAHRVITLATTEMDAAARWPFVRTKLRLIPNGIAPFHLKEREAARLALGKQASIPARARWIGTIAECVPNKGLDVLLEAAALLPNDPSWNLIIIGDGDDRPALERQAAQKKLNDRVFFLGHLAEARTYLRAFDCFVLPSRKEGLPYVILEAGLAGVAIVASDVGGIPSVILPPETGFLVPPGRADILARTLAFVLSRDMIRREAGRAIAERIAKHFSFAAMLTATSAVYRESPYPTNSRSMSSR